jgi:hypothetical protein
MRAQSWPTRARNHRRQPTNRLNNFEYRCGRVDAAITQGLN